jgi:hypothetical protein
MGKITANNVHRFDDIADTLYDAIKMALIDRILINAEVPSKDYDAIVKSLAGHSRQMDRLRRSAYGN